MFKFRIRAMAAIAGAASLFLLVGGMSTASAAGDRDKYYADPRTGEFWRIAGVCVTTSDWTAADAIEECHPELMAKEEPAKPAPTPEPRMETRTAVLESSALFGFDSAEVTSAGNRAIVDAITISQGETVQKIRVVGHTDRLGADSYNQPLSERRAQAVVRQLRGIRAMSDVPMEAVGQGSSNPVKTCDNSNRQALIDCLAPNRRVEIEVTVVSQVPAS